MHAFYRGSNFLTLLQDDLKKIKQNLDTYRGFCRDDEDRRSEYNGENTKREKTYRQLRDGDREKQNREREKQMFKKVRRVLKKK